MAGTPRGERRPGERRPRTTARLAHDSERGEGGSEIQQILQLLRAHGPISRADIARRSGVSKPTVSRLVRELEELGLVVEVGPADTDSGRKPILYAFNAAAGYVVGMDIGGTTTRGAIADLAGETIETIRRPTRQGGADDLIDGVARMVRELTEAAACDEARLLAVAIGTPGVIDPKTRTIRYCPNLPALEEPGFTERLERELERSVHLYNDVNLAAVGERARGAGRRSGDSVLLSVGTGVGIGLVLGGELYQGFGGRAGEFGYLPFPPGSPVTLEDALRGPTIAREHRAAGGSGRTEDAFGEAEAGAEPGLAVVSAFLERLAWTICAFATLLDPERVILAGGIGMRCEPFLPRLTERLTEISPLVPEIVVPELGDSAGLHGALCIALERSEPLLERMLGGDRVPPRN